MRVTVHELAGVAIVEPLDPLTRASEARDLVGACLEHRADSVLLDAAALSPELFELRSGLAGELLQKLQNYRIRLALVVPDERAHGERVAELLREAKRGASFRAFPTRGEAEAGLAREGASARA